MVGPVGGGGVEFDGVAGGVHSRQPANLNDFQVKVTAEIDNSVTVTVTTGVHQRGLFPCAGCKLQFRK